MHSFACPHCSTPLRIRDRSLFEQTLDCPDCGGPFRIEPDGRNGIKVVDGSEAATKTEVTAAAPQPQKSSRDRQRDEADRPTSPRAPRRRAAHATAAAAGPLMRLREALLTPVGISWLAAGTAGIGLLVAIRPWGDDAPAGAIAPAVTVADAIAAPQPADDSTDTPPEQTPPEAAPFAAPHGAPPVPVPAADREVAGAIGDAAPVEPPVDLPRQARAPPEPPALAADEPPAEPQPRRAGGDLEPVIPPAPPQTIDVVQALAQPIRKFDQSRPASVRDLLLLVEEMTAVPIRFDGIEQGMQNAALDRPVSLLLERTTAGSILDAVVAKAGMGYDVHADGISLRPATSAAPSRIP